MLLDPLIRRRERPESLLEGTVLTVDSAAGRVHVRTQSGMELWVGYVPEDFPWIEVNEAVVIGRWAGRHFLVGRLSKGAPTSGLVDV